MMASKFDIIHYCNAMKVGKLLTVRMDMTHSLISWILLYFDDY